MIRRMNMVMQYVEKHMKEDIEPIDIENIVSISFQEFQRMFVLLNGITFYEYVRQRRLSCAALEILHSSRKILDIAIDYGYESNDAFCVAFKKIYGYAPSELRKKNVQLHLFQPLLYDFKIHGKQNIVYEIKKVQQMRFSGLSIYSNKEENKAPAFWKEAKENNQLHNLLEKANTQVSYGLCFGYDHDGANRYMIAVEGIIAPYDQYEVKSTDFIVFKRRGKLYEILDEMWNAIYFDVLPYSHYDQIMDIPTIEKYYGGICNPEDTTLEIWIPVQRKSMK